MARTSLKDKAEDVKKSENLKYDLSKIDAAILDIKKEIGEDCIIDVSSVPDIPRVHSRSPMIGYIFGAGGTPEGRFIELYGPESAGKTLVAENIMADFQREGKFAAFVDAEFSFSAKYAQVQGLDVSPDKFRLFQPNTGEDAFTIVEKLAESGSVGIITVDSVAALVPRAEMEGEMTDQQMGAQARMIGKGMRKIASACAKNNCTIIFLNQLRMKIGVMMGNPETTPGGQALKFWASIRCEVRKGEKTEGEDNEDAVGIVAKIKNVKNKTSVPFRKGEIFISFKDGIDIYGEYVDFGVSFGIIQKGGAWFTVEDERFQGRANVIKALKERKDLFDKIASKVDTQLNGNPLVDVKLPESPDAPNPETSSLASQALG